MALRQGSLAYNISQLPVGATLSRSECLGLSSPALADAIRTSKTKMRNHLNKHASRASEACGSQYRMDTGSWVATDDGAVFVTVCITRVM